MPQRYALLTTSLYYNKEHWNTALIEIDAFLKGIAVQWPEINYLLEFNYTNSENIRLSMLAPEEMATEQATQIDKLIEDLPRDTQQRAPHNRTEVITQQEFDRFRHKIVLSKTIVEALKDEAIDDEIVVTFAFYLQMALDKVIMEKAYATLEQLINIYGGISEDFEANTLSDTANPEMNETRNQVLDIAQSIFTPGETNDTPHWLEAWMLSCEKELRQADGCTPHNKLIVTHGRIIYQLHKHLALDEEMSLTLSYYTRLALLAKRLERDQVPS